MSDYDINYSDDPTVQDRIEQLIDAGEELPDELREDIIDAGDEMGRALVSLVEHTRKHVTDAPQGDRPAIHAVELLGERGETDAIDELIEVVVDAPYDYIIHSRAIYALEDIGKPAVEPILERIETGVDEDSRDGLAQILATAGVRDERSYEILVDILDDSPGLGASYLTDYGDPEAIEPIRRKLATMDAVEGGLFDNDVVVELGQAIEKLGGELTEEEQDKVDRATRQRRRASEEYFAQRDAESDPDEPFEMTADEREEAKKTLALRRRRLRGGAKRKLKKAAKIARYRLEECWVNADWQQQHMANVIQVRTSPAGKWILTTLLVDLDCLGPKDAIFETDVPEERAKMFLDESAPDFEPCSPHLAAKIAREGALLAAHLGLPIPDEAFAVMQVFERYDPDKAEQDVVTGRFGKPFFVPGPADDVDTILDHLDERLGPDGYEANFPPWM